MAELINQFFWSFSAAKDFETCPRRRYWAKYAAWGGWSAKAEPRSRAAYRLSKMESRFTLAGRVAEEAVRWMLQRQQEGCTVSSDDAYTTIARPRLNTAWKQSKEGAWRADPKRHVCLHEHYYPELTEIPESEWTADLRDRVKRCLEHAASFVLPRLAPVRAVDEVPLDAPDRNRRVEGFEWEGITVFAVPDYVYRQDGQWHIHDWKTGRPKPEHGDQLSIYGLWASCRHGVDADAIHVYLEYLADGKVASEPMSESRLTSAGEWILSSVADMAAYLENADWKRNVPRPKEEWDMTVDRAECARCPFYELCKPELESI